MKEDEVNELREGLKAKWQAVNREYQKITHVKLITTVGEKRK